MVDLSRVIVSFIVINQCFVWFLRVDYLDRSLPEALNADII
ncbi:hypothetical protein [uncultured Gammaproteobacteria bacterium]|nr:hypothetical protein [uncultured Gammaproteobacteria bacterium]